MSVYFKETLEQKKERIEWTLKRICRYCYHSSQDLQVAVYCNKHNFTTKASACCRDWESPQ